jgi:ribonuclease VapC
MIVIDTSALIAILQDEPERPQFAALIARADRRMVSAVSLLEASIVARSRRGAVGVTALDEIVADAELEIIAFDDFQRRLAVQAFNTYGKGIHPSARLNFGDCAAYALAKAMNAPLLFKGTDFVATDLISARA